MNLVSGLVGGSEDQQGTFTAARPLVLLGGSQLPQVQDQLLHMLVEETTEGMARCELAIANVLPSADGGGFVIANRSLVNFGMTLEIIMASEEGMDPLFCGVVTGLEGRFPKRGVPQLAILAEDKLQRLRMQRRSQTFESFVDSAEAGQAAAAAGETVDDTEAAGVEPEGAEEGEEEAAVAAAEQAELAAEQEAEQAATAEAESAAESEGAAAAEGAGSAEGGAAEEEAGQGPESSPLVVTDSSAIRQLLASYGLTAQVNLGMELPTYEILVQLNQSDLAFIRERARAVGAEVWLQGQTLHVAPRSLRRGEQLALTYGKELWEFSVLADLTNQRTTVIVSGWDTDSKSAVVATGQGTAMTAELAGLSCGPTILCSALGPSPEQIVHTVPFSSSEAQAYADAAYCGMARRFVTGSALAAGDARIRVGARVTLGGLGAIFSGAYYVTETRHLFDNNHGYQTEFRVERPGIGG